jgi:hypothetical protein
MWRILLTGGCRAKNKQTKFKDGISFALSAAMIDL